MSYTIKNFRTKKDLKAAVAAGTRVEIFNPGLGSPVRDGTAYLEGPHFPAAHTWYAQAVMENGLVVAVK